jgi:DDE_Tnp_1-associated
VDPPPTSVSRHFAALTDPRVERRKIHLLVEIVTIPLCGVLCGADERLLSGALRLHQERLNHERRQCQTLRPCVFSLDKIRGSDSMKVGR